MLWWPPGLPWTECGYPRVCCSAWTRRDEAAATANHWIASNRLGSNPTWSPKRKLFLSQLWYQRYPLMQPLGRQFRELLARRRDAYMRVILLMPALFRYLHSCYSSSSSSSSSFDLLWCTITAVQNMHVHNIFDRSGVLRNSWTLSIQIRYKGIS